VIKLN